MFRVLITALVITFVFQFMAPVILFAISQYFSLMLVNEHTKLLVTEPETYKVFEPGAFKG